MFSFYSSIHLFFLKNAEYEQDKAREHFQRDVYYPVNEQGKRSATPYRDVYMRFYLYVDDSSQLFPAHRAHDRIFLVQTERKRGYVVFHTHRRRREVDDFQPAIDDVGIVKIFILFRKRVGLGIGIVNPVYVLCHEEYVCGDLASAKRRRRVRRAERISRSASENDDTPFLKMPQSSLNR